MAVFKVDSNFKVILNPEAVKLVPELSVLTDDEVLYIILVEDYCDGPFRKKPYDERRSLAIKKVFGDKTVDLETDRIKLGSIGYKSLVFDIRRETRDIYLKKISFYQKEALAMNIEFKRLKELDSMIQYLEERVEAIDKSLESDDISDIKIKGNRKLSYVEIWQQRQIEYRKFKQTS